MNRDNRANPTFLLIPLAIGIILLLIEKPFLQFVNKPLDDDAKRYYYPGVAAYQQGHYADAEEKLKDYLDMYPGDGNTLYRIGLCTLAEGKKKEARSDFQASVAARNGRGNDAFCGQRRCKDVSGEMLTWMDQNPTWDASQATSVPPPFPNGGPGE